MHVLFDTARIAIDAYRSGRMHGTRRLAAGLAYYLLFSLAPLVLLVVMIGGLFMGASRTANIVISIMNDLLGSQVGFFIQEIVHQGIDERTGIIATLIAVGFVIWGASRFILHLNEALIIMYRPEVGLQEVDMKTAVKQRACSIFYLALLALLIIAIFLFNILLPFFLELIRDVLPIISKGLLFHIQAGAVFVIMLLVFVVVYKTMVPIKLSWNALFVGSAVASLLFIVINTLFSLYVAFVSDISFYGALGSIFALLIWTYWTSQALLYGAEVSKIYSRRNMHIA